MVAADTTLYAQWRQNCNCKPHETRHWWLRKKKGGVKYLICRELKLQLEDVPDDAEVRFVSGSDDNLLTDYYDTSGTVFVNDARNNMSYLYIIPT